MCSNFSGTERIAGFGVLVQKEFMDVIRFYEKLGFCIHHGAGPDDADPRFVLMSRVLNEKSLV